MRFSSDGTKQVNDFPVYDCLFDAFGYSSVSFSDF